ncbi:Aste57867_15893 [Aphanomyces stellatus]|uniref:Aste57867_15893 protein n=1 Tax=Aphanomyces stellatus TaxID=120398 RepID=A0A485L560_9STRA|nr:hypothetical protein As57867_015837 [Aphanomyces stellatus]VFT92680.1 Aste57867_15893 [Aphanomyces stellatus]
MDTHATIRDAPGTSTSGGESGHPVLGASTDEASTDESEPRPKQINMFRKRQREELDFLRGHVTELQAQLASMHQKQAFALMHASPWQRLATQLKDEKDQALHDNEYYREALQAQIEFGNALHAVLAKRPRLTMAPTLDDVPWKTLHLTAHAAQRLEAVRAISLHQFTQLANAFVSGGLVDCVTDMSTSVPKSWVEDLLVVESSICRFTTVAFEDVAETVWAVLVGDIPDARHPLLRLEAFGDDIFYVEAPRRLLGMDGRNLDVVRRFKEPRRHVIVSRSILQDDVRPHDTSFVCNEATWLVVDGTEAGGTKTSIKFFMRTTPPLLLDQSPSAPDMKTIIQSLLVNATAITRDTENTIMQFL